VEKQERVNVQVTPKSLFLAKQIYHETSPKKLSTLEVVLSLCELLLRVERPYVLATMEYSETEEAVPVGVSVCVAGHYLLSTEPPTLLAGIVARTKEEIVVKFGFPCFVLSLLQVVLGAMAVLCRYYGSKRRELCKVCATRFCDRELEPCGHKSCCRLCSMQIGHCPSCGTKITHVIASQ